MRTPFTMDSAGFLTLLDALERRFNEVTAASSLSFAGIDGDLYPVVQPARAGEEDCADRGESADFAQSAGVEDSAQPEPAAPCPGARCDSALRSPASTPLSCDFHGRTGAFHDEVFDPQLVELASSAFGSTCWASLMCVASLGLDAALVECARQFLTHTSIIVRQKGLAVWLYDLINDATMAMLLGQTSPRMPVTIRPMSQVQISRWLHGSGVKRFGSQQQRAADRAEYGNQAHRLAAYCMLRWGAPTASSAQIATMLLTNPGIGMCMLREDPNVRAQGACTDTRCLTSFVNCTAVGNVNGSSQSNGGTFFVIDRPHYLLNTVCAWNWDTKGSRLHDTSRYSSTLGVYNSYNHSVGNGPSSSSDNAMDYDSDTAFFSEPFETISALPAWTGSEALSASISVPILTIDEKAEAKDPAARRVVEVKTKKDGGVLDGAGWPVKHSADWSSIAYTKDNGVTWTALVGQVADATITLAADSRGVAYAMRNGLPVPPIGSAAVPQVAGFMVVIR